ncbi:hypothetical protein DPEC_G00294590 [Dallia pectoralis]|uniref:Uncharacterized protein n=1 Tax=Dallia pectoralis TaxID=75939 RepID=A0ACC2FIN8_DALPE|nr:hypothetical protein DPEC_G00294590 [Dallia pectoralis]
MPELLLAKRRPPDFSNGEIAFCPPPQQINEVGAGELHTVTSQPGLSDTAACSKLAACSLHPATAARPRR